MAQRKPRDPIDHADQAETPLDEVTATYVPRTELGRRLLELRAKLVRSGVPLLGRAELEREIAELRGGLVLREYEERQTT